jgi:NAD(P)-dependent dehydrogenase (short-subunit alcohol dehydrogenase family)
MSSASRKGFGAQTTTEMVLEGIDLRGVLALVTGGTSGLGKETARALAAHGAEVVITARDMVKGEAVSRELAAATGASVEVEELELGSLASVRAFAGRFLARHSELQILVNNAGIMACPPGTTADGFELQFGTNHLGHFLLTCLLAPALRQGAPARVIALSSRAHHMSPVIFDDINFERRPYQKWVSYGQSKTANVLFAVELERRLGPFGVHAFAVHPGVIHTGLSRYMEPADWEQLQARAAQRGEVMAIKSVEAGAATTVYAATAPELAGLGGSYLEDCGLTPVNDAENATAGVRSYAVDGDAAAQLWSLSEEWVGTGLVG